MDGQGMDRHGERTDRNADSRGNGRPRLLVAALAATAVLAEGVRRVSVVDGDATNRVRFAALVVGAALLFTVGGIFMKLSEGASRPAPSAIMAGCFVAGAVLQALAMRGGDLGVVYVIVLGVEAVLAMAFGWLFFSESMTVWKIGGALLIVLGIVSLRAS